MASWRVTVLERLPLGRNRPLLAYGCTLALCGFAIGMRVLATPMLNGGYPYVGFFPVVILSAFLFGAGPGLLAGLLCGVVTWYCFIPPVFAVKLSGSVVFAMGFYLLVVLVDVLLIHWLQRVNGRLAEERERNRRLAERGELLFRELQHRVSNNLQVVSGLLLLQMREVTDAAARKALDEAGRRLGLIGRIHRQLYSPHGDQLNLGGFLHQLCADLIDASGKAGVDYRIEAAEDIALAPDAAIPMALIVAEAITNALEHGFAGRDSGLIAVNVAWAADGGVELQVTDNGAGLPADFDLGRSDSLGLKLAQMLARQLGGSFTLATGHPTTALLRLPQSVF